MHFIAYISQYTGDDIKTDLNDIYQTSSKNNRNVGISGVLLFYEDRFLQALEGRRSDLENLMAKIQKDPRHKNVVRIIDKSIDERTFEDWNMDTFYIQNSKVLNWDIIEFFKDEYCKLLSNFEPKMFISFLKDFVEDPEAEGIMLSARGK